MKYVQTKTVKVRKTTVFLIIILILGLMMATGTVYSTLNSNMGTLSPTPVTADYFEGMELIQLKAPPEDAPRAVISTSAGDMTVVLYRNEAPEAVRRFTEECENGSYNGLKAQAIDSSVFTLDSPSEEAYAPELNKNLWPFKGSLCMTEKGDIVFVNTVTLSEEDKSYLLADNTVLKDVSRTFAEKGGVPNYARVYAVFGQIIEGSEVIEKITASGDAEVTVNSVTIN